jgi:hypothetical protein
VLRVADAYMRGCLVLEVETGLAWYCFVYDIGGRSEGIPRLVCGTEVRRERVRRCHLRCIMKDLVSRSEMPRADKRDINETAA